MYLLQSALTNYKEQLKSVITIEVLVGIVLLLTALLVVLLVVNKSKNIETFKISKDGVHIGKSEQNKEKDKEQDNKLDQIIKIGEQLQVECMDLRQGQIDVNVRLDEQYEMIKKSVELGGTGVGYSGRGAPYKETVYALLTLIALGLNGNTDIRLKEVVFGYEGKVQAFNSTINEFINNPRNKALLKDNSQFFDRIKDITRGWGTK